MSKESTSESSAGADHLCSVGGCTRKARYKKSGWCQTHYHRWWRTGSLEILPRPVRADLTYFGAHGRVKALWGSATKYECVKCGDSAKEWAYDATDPESLQEDISDKYPVTYSAWPEFYMPLCTGCHRLLDAGARAKRLTHCKRGHEFTPENTYRQPSKPMYRNCMECRRIDGRLRKRRKLDAARVARGEEPKWKDQA